MPCFLVIIFVSLFFSFGGTPAYEFLRFCREAIPGGELESRKNPRNLPRGAQILRGQPTKTEVADNIRQTPLSSHRPPNSGQPELRNVFLPQTPEQKAASLPGGDMGRQFVTRSYAFC